MKPEAKVTSVLIGNILEGVVDEVKNAGL